jgi:hypothetical protein
MTVTVEIELATLDDLPTLAIIQRLAYESETISNFAWKTPSAEIKGGFYRARIEERFNDPEALLYKAVSPETGKILGFICLTLEKAVQDATSTSQNPTVKLSPTAAAFQQFMGHMHVDFVMKTGAEMEALKSATVEKDEHYCKSWYWSPTVAVMTPMSDEVLTVNGQIYLHLPLSRHPKGMVLAPNFSSTVVILPLKRHFVPGLSHFPVLIAYMPDSVSKMSRFMT